MCAWVGARIPIRRRWRTSLNVGSLGSAPNSRLNKTPNIVLLVSVNVLDVVHRVWRPRRRVDHAGQSEVLGELSRYTTLSCHKRVILENT